MYNFRVCEALTGSVRASPGEHPAKGRVTAAGSPQGGLEVEALTCALSAQRPSTCPSPCPSAECYRRADSSHSQDPATPVASSLPWKGRQTYRIRWCQLGNHHMLHACPEATKGGRQSLSPPARLAGVSHPCASRALGGRARPRMLPFLTNHPGQGGRQDDSAKADTLTSHAPRLASQSFATSFQP